MQADCEVQGLRGNMSLEMRAEMSLGLRGDMMLRRHGGVHRRLRRYMYQLS